MVEIEIIYHWSLLPISPYLVVACMPAWSRQWYLTLCDPMAHSLPGSSVHFSSTTWEAHRVIGRCLIKVFGINELYLITDDAVFQLVMASHVTQW